MVGVTVVPCDWKTTSLQMELWRRRDPRASVERRLRAFASSLRFALRVVLFGSGYRSRIPARNSSRFSASG